MSNGKNKDINYTKSLNRLMIISLTGIAALGASMLAIESSKSTTIKDESKTSLSFKKSEHKFSKIKLPSSNVTNLN